MISKNSVKKNSILKRMIRLMVPYWYLVVFCLTFFLFDTYAGSLEPIFTQRIIDTAFGQQQYEALNSLLLSWVVIITGNAVFNTTGDYFRDYISQRTMADMRRSLLNSLQKKSFAFYDRNKVGELTSKMTVDVQATGQLLGQGVETIASMIMAPITVIILMYGINPTMTWVALAPTPFIFLFNWRYSSKIRPLMREQQEILGNIGVKIQQNIFGMKVVRTFQKEEEAVESYKEVEDKYLQNGIYSGKLSAENMPLSGYILAMAVAGIYVYGANMVLSPEHILTVGELYMFTRYVTRLTMPFRRLSNIVTMYTNAAAGAERIFAVLDEEPDVQNIADTKVLPHIEGEVRFEHVDFEYLPGKPALRDVDFTAKPGEIIAILGPTGSGKSTLIYLIPRFYDVTGGRILIDGTDVRDVTLKSLRRQVGVVLQEIFLFTGTIRYNISFGRPDATQEEIENAAKLAKAHDFIMSFPQSYDTMVGERGVTLSGGQKQRIAIARTLLTDPRILILDDSMSYVDAKTEQDIQQALKAVMMGRTTFVIAQRLSTIKNAHRIMVLEKGRITEMGTHEELIASNGIYKRIYETQFEALAEVPLVYGSSSSEVT